MRFVYDFTVSAGTTKADPEEMAARMVKGRLFHVEIAYPPGPANLVRTVIKDALYQVVPANPDASLGWDDYTHKIDMDYELTDRAHELTLVGWSPSAVYDHTITFRFDVEPAEGDGERTIIERLAELLALPGR